MVVRVCKKCEAVKDISEFSKGKSKGKAFIRFTCLECEKKRQKEYNKQYYQSRKKKNDNIDKLTIDLN